MVKSGEQQIALTFSDSKIIKSDSTVIPLDSMNQTYNVLPQFGPDINGWYNYNMEHPADAPEEGANLNGAVFSTTVTVNTYREPTPDPAPELGPPVATGYYHAHGQQIVDPDGNICILKGISFGNMNYGNPSSVEVENGNGVRNHHDAESYKEIATMGMDHVRFEFNYGLFEDDDAIGVYKESGFDWIDENIAAAKEAGVKLILQMKSPQGGYQESTRKMYGSNSGGKALWIDLDENGNILPTENYKTNQDRLINLWKAIAERYKDEPTIIGYGLLNEPVVPQKNTATETVDQWRELAQKIADAIRTVDNNHALFVEGICSYFLPGNYDGTNWNLVSLADKQFTINDTNTIYEFHFYEPLSYTHQGADWMTESYGELYYDGISVAEIQIIDWNSKGSQVSSSIFNSGEWTYFETPEFSISSTYNVAQLQISMSNLPANTNIWVDDLKVTRTNKEDGTTVTMLAYDFTDSVGGFFKVWNYSDDFNAIEIDNSVGKNALGSMKLTNTLSSTASPWANAQSIDFIVLEEGYTYKFSGYIKGGENYHPTVNFLKANKAFLMNKSYLSYLLDTYSSFSIKNNVPLHVGEWGVHYNCYNKGAAEYIKDLAELFEEKGLSNNFHAYHDSAFGLYLGEEYTPRLQRNEELYILLTTYYCTPTQELLNDIEITKLPNKTQYEIGEYFNPAGMIVTAKYINNTSKTITEYTYTPQGPLSIKDDSIIVSYKENGIVKTAVIPITVTACETAGDMNGDGEKNTDDAIYLLRHVLLPTSYPIKQDGDVSGDGEVNTDDAIYLLRHVLMPSSYPLK